MSISHEENVSFLENFVNNRDHENFDALYPAVEKQLSELGENVLLAKVYLYRSQMYFYRSKMEVLVRFIVEKLAFMKKYAEQEDLLRFKNVRALALDLIGYREGFYEQMLEMMEYGEAHQKNKLVILAKVNLGLLKGREKKAQEALAYFQEAYELNETNKHEHEDYFNMCCSIVNNIFIVYLNIGELENAAKYLTIMNDLKNSAERYEMFYRLNAVKYYLYKGDYEKTREYIAEIRSEIETDALKAMHHFDLVEIELDFAKRTGDLLAQKEAYKQLIARQKKSKQDRMLQLLIQSEYESKRHELMEASQCDPLTKLLNRRGFIYHTEQLKRVLPSCTYIACAMLDIDYFKNINDEYGHLAGDQVISQVAEVLKKREKEGFVCSRYGGDEFVFTFVDNSEMSINEKVSDLFSELQQTEFIYEDKRIPVTLTMGVIYVVKNETCPVEKLLSLADDVMYDVKRNGRAYYVVKYIDQKETVV